ncbi:MAG: crossover junction endodeoxyribonuclease RuvC [Opitutales bacterium]|nr:crossover junction endodeoxyribonuclease RuvC [Opitutales bacterium]
MARASSRNLWKAHLEGKDAPSAKTLLIGKQGQSFRGTVMGIDPSLRGTGVAIIEYLPGRPPLLLHSETLTNSTKLSQAECLAVIFQKISEKIEIHGIRTAALEETIYVQNYQTAMTMGAVRGTLLTALTLASVDIHQYAPLRIKQAVVGVGRASKQQMIKTVRGILKHGADLASDEADAAGAALCHAFTWRGPAPEA